MLLIYTERTINKEKFVCLTLLPVYQVRTTSLEHILHSPCFYKKIWIGHCTTLLQRKKKRYESKTAWPFRKSSRGKPMVYCVETSVGGRRQLPSALHLINQRCCFQAFHESATLPMKLSTTALHSTCLMMSWEIPISVKIAEQTEHHLWNQWIEKTNAVRQKV